MNKVLISVLGEDKPGILASVTRVIKSHSGNIENLSQTLLQNVFGALFIVELPAAGNIESLKQDLSSACTPMNLFVHVDTYRGAIDPDITTDMQPYIVTAIGPDQPGLVAEVSELLAQHAVNITNLQAIFKGGDKPLNNLMIFEVDVPRSTVMKNLRNDLQNLSQKLTLEINIQHRKIFEAVSHIED